MNLKNRLLHIADKLEQNRACGKTSLLSKITKELDGVLLVANFAEAKRVEKTLGVTSKSVEINLDGFSGPFFLDNHAAASLLQKAAGKIEQLEQELENFRRSFYI